MSRGAEMPESEKWKRSTWWENKSQCGGRTMWLNQLKDVRHTSGVHEGFESSSHLKNSYSDIMLCITLRNKYLRRALNHLSRDSMEPQANGLQGWNASSAHLLKTERKTLTLNMVHHVPSHYHLKRQTNKQKKPYNCLNQLQVLNFYPSPTQLWKRYHNK